MLKTAQLLGVIFLLMASTLSCTYHHDSSKPGIKEHKLFMQEISLKLKRGQSFKKEFPFVARSLEPYLNGKWIGNAVSYGCYRKGQAPGHKGPGEAEILEDLMIITKYWHLIRVYGADDDSERILRVIKKHELPVKVMLGVWLENETKNPVRKKANIAEALRAIELANQYPNVIAAVNVGNETQVFWSWHRMKTENLIRYIRAVRNNTVVPVTTADDYNFWNKPESKQVADEVDFIVSHIYPLWNGKTLENAIEWLNHIYYQEVQKNHPEKVIAIGETGWATTYNPEKKGPGEQGSLIKGAVSLKAQEKYLMMLHAWINKYRITTFYFEAFDEPWKGGGDQSDPREVEKHWGVFYENRTPKASFQNYLRHVRDQ
jgi:exo-beta-1,3-glucanase (GH17 family)